jgi:hypothetical protein
VQCGREISSAALSEVQISTTRYTCLSKLEIFSKLLRERHGQQEPEQDLHAGRRDAHLLQELDQPARVALGFAFFVDGSRSRSATNPDATRRQAACTSIAGRSRLRSDSIDLRMSRETCICDTPTRSAISRWVRPS